MPETVRLFGFDFLVAPDVAAVADRMMADLGHLGSGLHFVITPNAAQSVYYNEDRHAALRRFFTASRYVLPDGMPIVWLGRKEAPEMSRLAGSDLFPELWKRIRGQKLNAVFVLPSEALAGRLRAEYSGCRFIVPPMFEAADEAYIAELAAKINAEADAVSAEFVFIGLGFPKQELIAMQMAASAQALPKPRFVLLLGASFEFYFGLKSRAPEWMQRSGLEWLHRFASEPRRMWKRYTVDNARFIWLSLQEVSARKRDE
jgi:N-acetylglucosaminyldiphosphoundecaprenol N-acetyl-beta-D-mannosaminyltransferase